MAIAVKDVLKNALPEWLQGEIIKITGNLQKDWNKGILVARKEFELAKDVALINYNMLRECIGKLNVILRSCTNNNNNEKVMFGLRIKDSKSILWKTTTRVLCLKVNLLQKTVKLVRTLTISGFWRLRAEILEEVRYKNLLESSLMEDFQLVDHDGEVVKDENEEEVMTNTDLPVPFSLTTSGIFKKVEMVTLDENTECLICMDNKIEVSLPCAHSFCTACISTWHDTNKSCPVCRDHLDKTEDCWEFTDLPDLEEINEKVVELATGD